MQVHDFLLSTNQLEFLAGIILFYIVPYTILVLAIDSAYYRMKGKDNPYTYYKVYTYSPIISLVILVILHVLWNAYASAETREYNVRMTLTIAITPLLWICTEIIRYNQYKKSIIQLLQ